MSSDPPAPDDRPADPPAPADGERDPSGDTFHFGEQEPVGEQDPAGEQDPTGEQSDTFHFGEQEPVGEGGDADGVGDTLEPPGSLEPAGGPAPAAGDGAGPEEGRPQPISDTFHFAEDPWPGSPGRTLAPESDPFHDGATSADADPGEAQRFGRYRLIGELGRGGMGVVYRAYDPQLDRLVALKVLLAQRYAQPDQRERFLREARAAGRLDHPRVVRIFDIGSADDQLYFAMELVEGPSLADRLHDGPMAPLDVARIGAAVARGLAHAHAAGLVHRDIKPANILLDELGQPRITDFGLVAEAAGDGARLTFDGQVMGTPLYMSPEQARGALDTVGPRWDLYSLGAVLYELLCGSPPYDQGQPRSVLHAVLTRPPTRLHKRKLGLPGDLVKVVERAMARDPRDRFADMEALADDLERFARGEPVESGRHSVSLAAVRAVRRSRRWLRVAGLLVVVGAFGIATVRAWQRWSQEQALAAREDAAGERLDVMRARVAEYDAQGETERATRLFGEFAAMRGNEQTAALARAWLLSAERAKARGDEAAATSAYVEAFSHATTEELEGEALLALAQQHSRSSPSWGDVATTLDALGRRAPAAAASAEARRLGWQAAAAGRDLARAAQEAQALGDRRAGSILGALQSATPSGYRARGAWIVDLGADGRPEVLALDAHVAALDVLDGGDPSLPRRGRVSLAGLFTEAGNRSVRNLPDAGVPFVFQDGAVGLALSDRSGQIAVARLTGTPDEPRLDVIARWADDYPASAVSGDVDGDGVEELYIGIGTYARRLWELRPEPDGTWSRRAPHPPSNRLNSEVVDLHVVDLDGDGDRELLGALREWGAFDVRVWAPSPDGPYPLRRVARRKLGFVGALLPLPDPRGPGHLVVAAVRPYTTAPQVFPEGHRDGVGDALWLLRWRGDGFERVRALSTFGGDTLQRADLDGDGQEELLVHTFFEGRAAAMVHALDADLAPTPEVTLTQTRLFGALDADGDGDDELLVSLPEDGHQGRAFELWVVGAGDQALPRLPAGQAVEPVPVLRDLGLRQGWSRAEELIAAGWREVAAERLVELAELSTDAKDAARARFRAAQLFSEVGRPGRAARLYLRAAEHPVWAERGAWAAAQAFDADYEFEAAREALERLLRQRTLRPKRAAEIAAEIERLDAITRLYDDPLVLDFRSGDPGPVAFLDPLAMRHLPGRGGLVVEALNGADLLRVPVRWQGGPVSLELEATLRDWEWSSGLTLVLRRRDAPDDQRRNVALSLVGGGGGIAGQFQCHVPERSTASDFLPLDSGDGFGRFTLRWAHVPDGREPDCKLTVHEAGPEWVARASELIAADAVSDGHRFRATGRHLTSRADAVQDDAAPTEDYELVLRRNGVADGPWIRLRAVVHSIRAAGVELATESPATDGQDHADAATAHLVGNRPDQALPLLPPAGLARAAALLDLGRDAAAVEAAVEAWRGATDPAVRAHIERHLVGASEPAWARAAREALGPRFPIVYEQATRTARHVHLDQPEVRERLTLGLSDLDTYDLAPGATPREAQRHLGLAVDRAAAWRLDGSTASARLAQQTAERLLQQADARFAGDPEAQPLLHQVRGELALERARLALAQGDTDAALGAVEEALAASPVREVLADRVLADSDFAPLHDHERWLGIERVSAPHRAWGEDSYPPPDAER